MGLDQKLTVFREGVSKDNEYCLIPKEYNFRKASALQGYFERNYGTENLIKHEVFDYSIEELKEYTDYILENPEDISYIKENFPPTKGIFYGSTEIDEWYFEEVEKVSKVVNEILKTDKVASIYYWCWW